MLFSKRGRMVGNGREDEGPIGLVVGVCFAKNKRNSMSCQPLFIHSPLILYIDKNKSMSVWRIRLLHVLMIVLPRFHLHRDSRD